MRYAEDGLRRQSVGGCGFWNADSGWAVDTVLTTINATDIDLPPVAPGVTLEEGFHPNYWGQLAIRNCLRQLWNSGTITSGSKCTPLRGKNERGEPNMSFTPSRDLTLL